MLQVALGVELLDDGGVPFAGLHALELLGGGEEVIGPRKGLRLQIHRLGDLEAVQAGPLAVQLDLTQDGLLRGWGVGGGRREGCEGNVWRKRLLLSVVSIEGGDLKGASLIIGQRK